MTLHTFTPRAELLSKARADKAELVSRYHELQDALYHLVTLHTTDRDNFDPMRDRIEALTKAIYDERIEELERCIRKYEDEEETVVWVEKYDPPAA